MTKQTDAEEEFGARIATAYATDVKGDPAGLSRPGEAGEKAFAFRLEW